MHAGGASSPFMPVAITKKTFRGFDSYTQRQCISPIARAFKHLGSVIGHRFFSRASVFFERKRLQLNLLCSFGLFSIRFVSFFIAGNIIGLRGKFLFFLMDNRGNTFFEGQIDVFITVSDFVDLLSLSYCLLFISIACCTLFFFTITDVIIFCFGV